MSYDLLFWRQQSGDRRPPANIAELLYEGQRVSGLDDLPIQDIVIEINRAFSGLTTLGGLTFWEGGSAGMFEVHQSQQHVHFCCRQLLDDHCNSLIEIMAAFGCPLYDPQVDQRFDGTS